MAKRKGEGRKVCIGGENVNVNPSEDGAYVGLHLRLNVTAFSAVVEAFKSVPALKPTLEMMKASHDCVAAIAGE